MLSLDLETELIRPAHLAPRIACLAMTDGKNEGVYSHELAAEIARDIFEREIPIVGANVAFDLACLAEVDLSLVPAIFAAYDAGRVHDVQLRQKLIDIADGRNGGYFDVQAQRYVQYGYSLADLEHRYFKRDRSSEKGADAWRMRYGELRPLPISEWPAEAREYPLRDVRGTLDVYLAQEERTNVLGDEASQCRAAWALHLMSAWGIKTDPDAIARLEAGARADYERLTELLINASLVRPGEIKQNLDAIRNRVLSFLPDAPRTKGGAVSLAGAVLLATNDPLLAALKADNDNATPELLAAGLLEQHLPTRDTKAAKARMVAVCEAAGVRWKLTDTAIELAKERGKGDAWPLLTEEERAKYVSLDEEACLESADDLLIAYAERTSVNAVVNSHIPRLKRGVVTPIQSRFEPLLETGRTSCRMGSNDDEDEGDAVAGKTNGYQLQNPRREHGIRECFVPRPGFAIGDVDFDMLELRTVAQVCKYVVGYSTLGEALNAGKDVHRMMGAAILGISYEEATACKDEKRIKDARQLGKVPNFGFPGGMGPAGFRAFASKAYRLKLSLEECRGLRRTWIEQWPEFAEYFEAIRNLCGEEEIATVEHFFSGRVRGMIPFTVTCNTFFQGLGADGAKAALYEVARRCYVKHPSSALYGSRVINFVHDQILAEHPLDIAHEAVHEMRDVMVTACNRYLPDYPVTASPVLSMCWSKDAAPVWKDGRLIPWTEDMRKAA